MTLIDIARKVERLAVDNSPSIMTGLGIVGVVTTAYLTGTASVKATRILDAEYEAMQKKHPKENLKQIWTNEYQIRQVWSLYIPAAGSLVLTIGAVIAAHQIGSRRAAAVAAAYSLSEKAFAEYKEKVYDKIGEKKEQFIRDEIAQDRVNRDPLGPRQVIVTRGGDVLCYESLTGRYFTSDMETLRRAENDINKQILSHDYASLTDFFDKIGLTSTEFSEEVGWNHDHTLELQFSTVLSEDGRPCISVHYAYGPIRKYFRQH